MSASKRITGSITAPKEASAFGYFELISFLDEAGYFKETSSFHTALSNAGLKCVNLRSSFEQSIFTTSEKASGLFANGVSAQGETLLKRMASDGFEGEICDTKTGAYYVLDGGALITNSHAADNDNRSNYFAPVRRYS